MSTSVLVLGASGWVGASVLRAGAGDALGVARSTDDARKLVPWTGPADLAELLRNSGATMVINCAGTTHGDEASMHEANEHLPQAIGEECLRAGVRLVHLGSAAEYGPADGRAVREDSPGHPQTPYGRSKLAGTHALLALAERGLDVTVVRPFNLVGPGQPLTTPVGEFAAAVRALPAGGGVVVCRDSSLIRDFLDLAGCAKLTLDVAHNGSGTPIVNVCSGRGVSFREFIEAMADVRGVPVTVSDTSPGGIRTVVGDPSLLHSLVGVRPLPSVRELAEAAMASEPT